jgi:hypothetical protein
MVIGGRGDRCSKGNKIPRRGIAGVNGRKRENK